MSLYLVIQSINYPIGEVELEPDREYTISTQEPLPRQERTNWVQHRQNSLFLPYHYDQEYAIGRPHASVSKLSETSAWYTPLFEPDDKKERPTAFVSKKRFWHALPFLEPKEREVRLQKNVPFQMRLEERCVIPIGGTYSLYLSNLPVFEAFSSRMRAAVQ